MRVTYKAEKGGSFTDKDGKSVKELHHDVIKGLKSDYLPEPKALQENETKEEGKYYITPDDGKNFIKWDDEPTLNLNTIIDKAHTFKAYFDWSGLVVKELVRTEAFKDPQGKWTNDFAPTIEELKKQIKWVNKNNEEVDLPAGTTVKIVDENDLSKELTQDDIDKN